MGLFSRMKKGVKAKANAAVDKMIDPEKELDIAIMELDEQRKKAIAELISYKTTAKQMERDVDNAENKSAAWEKKAMLAVKSGDDDLARKALKEKKYWLVEAEKIRRDRDEAAGYAIELNRSRKQADTKLKILKLRKGTMATQIAAARSGGDSPFGHDNEVWDKFARAEEQIDDATIQAEVEAALDGEDVDGLPLMIESSAPADRGDADAALALLKAKMHSEKKKLPK
jgi:phage shock protein A